MKAFTLKSIAAALAASTAVMAGAGNALAQYGPDGRWGFHPMMGFGGGWIGMIMGFVFWGLIIVGLVFFIKWLAQSASGKQPTGSGRALEILKERYASGEIDKDQYESMKRDLQA